MNINVNRAWWRFGAFAALLLNCILSPTTVAQSQVAVTQPVTAIPESGTTSDDVGLYLDAHFRPLRQSALGDGASARVVEDQRTYRLVTSEASSAEVRANATVWGIQGAVSGGMSYGYIRAVQVERVYSLPRTADLSSAPATAAYVISRMSYGRMYEMRVSGQRAAVSARIDGIIGSAAGAADTSSTRVEGLTLGLMPRGDGLQALAASTPEQILERFEVRGAPVPILIEYEPLTRRASDQEPVAASSVEETLAIAAGAGVPTAGSQAPVGGGGVFEVSVLGIDFPPGKPGNGWPWDVGSGPDMTVQFVQNNQVVFSAPAPNDTGSHRFQVEQRFPSAIEVSVRNPLLVYFIDRDFAANDSCGVATVTSLVTGDMTLVSQQNARVLIRVQRIQ